MSVNSRQERKHCIKAKGKWNPEQRRTNVPSLRSKHVVSEKFSNYFICRHFFGLRAELRRLEINAGEFQEMSESERNFKVLFCSGTFVAQ